MADRIIQDGVSIREMAGRDGVNGTGSNTAELIYLCRGSSDPLVCRDALLAQSTFPVFNYDGLVLESLARERIGDDNWQFTLSFADVPEVGGYTVGIDTSGGLVKVTEAFSQAWQAAPGETATNFGTSIDVQDGKAQGVDRVIPSLKLNITAKIPTAYLGSPITYAKWVASVTGFVNQTTYLTFAPGELLFVGATGQVISENPTLTYTFWASQNLQNGSIGPISGIVKEGHDYLWIDYRTLQDPSSSRITQLARTAYVAKIYGKADFNILGIGVSASSAEEHRKKMIADIKLRGMNNLLIGLDAKGVG